MFILTATTVRVFILTIRMVKDGLILYLEVQLLPGIENTIIVVLNMALIFLEAGLHVMVIGINLILGDFIKKPPKLKLMMEKQLELLI